MGIHRFWGLQVFLYTCYNCLSTFACSNTFVILYAAIVVSFYERQFEVTWKYFPGSLYSYNVLRRRNLSCKTDFSWILSWVFNFVLNWSYYAKFKCWYINISHFLDTIWSTERKAEKLVQYLSYQKTYDCFELS